MPAKLKREGVSMIDTDVSCETTPLKNTIAILRRYLHWVFSGRKNCQTKVFVSLRGRKIDAVIYEKKHSIFRSAGIKIRFLKKQIKGEENNRFCSLVILVLLSLEILQGNFWAVKCIVTMAASNPDWVHPLPKKIPPKAPLMYESESNSETPSFCILHARTNFAFRIYSLYYAGETKIANYTFFRDP